MAKPGPVPPEGKVGPDDIRAKLSEIEGSVESTTKAAMPLGIAVGAGAVLVVVIIAFALGKRLGRKRRTVVEIRRM